MMNEKKHRRFIIPLLIVVFLIGACLCVTTTTGWLYGAKSAICTRIPLKVAHYEGPGMKYEAVFKDKNNIQRPAAIKYGLKKKPQTRAELTNMEDELIAIHNNRGYVLRPMSHSVRLLCPFAAEELERIGLAFRDSLKVKNLPQYRIVVTSLLRTQEDVDKLKKENAVASVHSCHSYGTTFDISYIWYDKVYLLSARVNNEDLKKVLAEVLYAEKKAGRVYVLYEQNQPCFHITVRGK